jgi:hypothetical protein
MMHKPPTANMMAFVKDKLFIQYNSRQQKPDDDRRGLYDIARQIQVGPRCEATCASPARLLVDRSTIVAYPWQPRYQSASWLFCWVGVGDEVKPYVLLQGKQHWLIKPFSLQSLISLNLRKLFIHNPGELFGFTVRYRQVDKRIEAIEDAEIPNWVFWSPSGPQEEWGVIAESFRYSVSTLEHPIMWDLQVLVLLYARGKWSHLPTRSRTPHLELKHDDETGTSH